ncbi:MAG: leucine-rich repeat domain-containing protein [Ruminococcus sp.]|nr:leucine-rich repeat domain-containing protein [uncultured Schaedlerella sp.]MCI9152575.1 leucine-rich repeat domain-containing protein [Ruminococcus sp.]
MVPINEKEIITDKTDCEPDLAVDNEQNNITNPTDGNLIDGNLTDGKTDITTEEGTENPPAGEEVKNPDSSTETSDESDAGASEGNPDSSDANSSSDLTDTVPPLNVEEILDADKSLIEDDSQDIYTSNFSNNTLNTDNPDSEEDISDNSKISPDSLDTLDTNDIDNQDNGLVFSPASGILTVENDDGWTELSNFLSNTDAVKEIKISDGVNHITPNVFSLFTNLTSVTIPGSVTSIAAYVFQGCSSLKDISIGEGITSIEENAFSGCTALESITIPDSVKEISDNAFKGCSSLENIIIPDSVKEIGRDAFSGTNITNVVIRDDVTIESGAFNADCKISIMLVPDNSGIIDNTQYKDRNDLKDIIIPDGVTSISSNAFAGCTNLESVVFPKTGDISIGEFAFNDTKIESITIPSNVVSIGGKAFGSSALKEVRFEGIIPPVFEAWAFGPREKDFLIFVPYDSRGKKNQNKQEYERIFGKATLWFLPKVQSIKRQPNQSASFNALFHKTYDHAHKRNIASYEYQWEMFDPNSGEWKLQFTGTTYNIPSVTDSHYGTYRLKIIAKYGDGTLDQTIISDEFRLEQGGSGDSSGEFDYSGITKEPTENKDDDNNKEDNPPKDDNDSSQNSGSSNNSIGGTSFSWIQGNNNTAVTFPVDSSQENKTFKDALSASETDANKNSSGNVNGKDSSQESSNKSSQTDGEVNTLKSANRILVISILILCFIRLSMFIFKRKKEYEKNY